MNDNRDIKDILREIERKRMEESGDTPGSAIPDPEPEIAASEPETASQQDGASDAEESRIPETNETPEQPVSHSREDIQPEYENAPMTHRQEYAPRSGMNAAGNRPSGNRPPVSPDGRPVHKKSTHKKKKKRRRMSNRLPGVFLLLTLIFGSSIILSLVIIGYGKDMLGIGKSEENHVIIIEEGSTVEQVSMQLWDEGVIKSPKAFQLFSRLRKSDFGYIPGEHFVRPNMAYETIITELTEIKAAERGESREVTFPEGMNIFDAANIIEEEGICSASDFLFYFNSGGYGLDFEQYVPTDYTLKFKKMEGYLFPDTYIFYQNSEPDQVCQKIYFNFDQKMTSERYDKMKQLNLTLDQLITFASIVQLEAGRTEDMEDIASVFWNRIENPDEFGTSGRLESDPTLNYANKVIRPNMEYFDKAIVDAYNTMITPGLPPGAICNPGTAAIDAVLAHKSTNFYFFNANINTKVTYFAENYDQHLENLQKVEDEYAEAARLAAEAAAAEGN